ncbi:MAG: ribonuclease R [Neisseriaceae bacterium]|nr:ribonuclease R [Neisseriaceae bacterium]
MTKNKNNTHLRAQDPFLERERQKYEAPLPSREWVIQLLEEAGVPTAVADLAEKLGITEEEYAFFERRIGAMVRDGQVYINRRGLVCVAEKLALAQCRIEAHKDGFGFAVPLTPTGEGDFVLYERQMRGLMHGDIVTVRPAGLDRRGRREGRVLDIVQRAHSEVVGRLYFDRGVYGVAPEDKRLTQDIILTPGGERQAEDGQVVVVEMISYPEANRPGIGQVKEILGDYGDSGMEIEIAVRKHHLPHEFSAECLAATKKIPKAVRKLDLKGREDLRDLPLVTIDGETARDFDDAVYAAKNADGYRLVVAIADVSHYVTPGNGLDADAEERGTSVYFPRRVIPMLPEALSNGICSLNPEVDRLCMVCDIQFDREGMMKSYRFYPAVMNSKARLTYTQVWDWIEAGTEHSLKTEIDTLYGLFKLLLRNRHARGAMEFESTETQMIFNDDGKIERIVPVVRNEAHRLIEECMLAANVCAAQFLLEHKHPALYRSHLGPNPEKLAALREQLALTGLSLGGGDDPKPKDYAKLFEQFKGRPDQSVLQVMMLRSMQQAIYEPKNEGHFGLAYEAYTHFTSPIRRYPDLTVHRAIKAVLKGEQYKPKSWQSLGVHCSMAERRADDASRDVENWLKTYYMKDKVGEVFEGTITGMAQFGLFVTLDDIYVEGMVHISDLGQDYFNYRPEIMAIEGERTKVRFSLSSKVVVKVAKADLDTSRIDLVLISGGEVGKGKDKAPFVNDDALPGKKGKPAKRQGGRRGGSDGKPGASTDEQPKSSRRKRSGAPKGPKAVASQAPKANTKGKTKPKAQKRQAIASAKKKTVKKA